MGASLQWHKTCSLSFVKCALFLGFCWLSKERELDYGPLYMYRQY